MKHEALIDQYRGACSCRRMTGVYRMQGESQGAFTWRANEAYRAHLEAVRERETAQPGLFEGQSELFA